MVTPINKGWRQDAAPELSTASRPEEVVFVAECPYSPDRPQAVIWMNGYRAALAARAAPGLALTDEQCQVLQFLYGIGELDGCRFGDRPSGERGRYWWRKHLSIAFPTEWASRPTPEKASKT